MSNEHTKNLAPQRSKDRGMDEFKIEFKKIGNLEENTEQDGPYDIVCCSVANN